MNTTIKTFDFKSDAGELLASVRTLLINNVPWFVA
ncbi:transporter, partial [Citrobacter freundii]|nr:transporter [Citrobacter freundii]